MIKELVREELSADLAQEAVLLDFFLSKHVILLINTMVSERLTV